MTPCERRRWHNLCDPSIYLATAGMPLLFVTGTNDFAYPLDSLKMSYSIAPGPLWLCVRKEMPHGHVEGWTPSEIGAFMDLQLCEGPALPRVVEMETYDNTVRAPIPKQPRTRESVASAHIGHSAAGRSANGTRRRPSSPWTRWRRPTAAPSRRSCPTERRHTTWLSRIPAGGSETARTLSGVRPLCGCSGRTGGLQPGRMIGAKAFDATRDSHAAPSRARSSPTARTPCRSQPDRSDSVPFR